MDVTRQPSRPPPLRHTSLDSYVSANGESNFRTPSGQLYKNQAFAKALHRPSTPVTATFPKLGSASRVSSPLSRGSSEAPRDTPPTTPEPSEDHPYSFPQQVKEKQPEVKTAFNPQSSTAMSLWNDYHTTELLLRLSSGSPTFQQFEQPPRRVLDLGCGEGTWVKYAAAKWNSPDTHIDGLDMQPLWESSGRSIGTNELSAMVSWKVANFFNRLPYDDDTFDLVRAANLALSVPRDRWLPLLKEIRRVLRTGGHLELIEEDLFFPPMRHAALLHPSADRPVHPGLVPSESESEQISRFREVEESKKVTEYLEEAFESMLVNKYDIPRSHMHVHDAFSQAFGQKNVWTYPTQRIVVPHRNTDHSAKSAEGFRTPRKISFSSSQGPRLHTPDHGSEPVLPSSTAPKAVQMLSTGRRPGDLPTLVAPKAAKILGTATPSRPYQPAGFILLPNKFFECRPEVLEMHACRNMHIILTCKKALREYLHEHKDALTGLGAELTDEDFERIFGDAMWDYDSFKRRRLNWPENYPGLLMSGDDDDAESAASRNLFGLGEGRRRAQSTSCAFIPPVSTQDYTQIRVIRIFGATKAKELC